MLLFCNFRHFQSATSNRLIWDDKVGSEGTATLSRRKLEGELERPASQVDLKLDPVAVNLTAAVDKDQKSHLGQACTLIPEILGRVEHSPWLLRNTPQDAIADVRESIVVDLSSQFPYDLSTSITSMIGARVGYNYRIQRLENVVQTPAKQIATDDSTIFKILDAAEKEKEENGKMESIETGLEALRRAVRIHQLKDSTDSTVKQLLPGTQTEVVTAMKSSAQAVKTYLLECRGKLQTHIDVLKKVVPPSEKITAATRATKQWQQFEHLLDYFEILNSLIQYMGSFLQFDRTPDIKRGAQKDKPVSLKEMEALIVSLQGHAFGIKQNRDDLRLKESALIDEVKFRNTSRAEAEMIASRDSPRGGKFAQSARRLLEIARGQVDDFVRKERTDRWHEENLIEQQEADLKKAVDALKWDKELDTKEPLVLADRAFIFIDTQKRNDGNKVYAVEEVEVEPTPNATITIRKRGETVQVVNQWKVKNKKGCPAELDAEVVDNREQQRGIRSESYFGKLVAQAREKLEKRKRALVKSKWKSYLTEDGKFVFTSQPDDKAATGLLKPRR